MAEQHPIENLMMTAMTSLENMVDVNTIVGDMITSPDGTVIIPVSKVCFGFAAGGSEFNTNKLNKFSENAKLPFGGGSGAGVHISPMAFVVVKDGNTRLMTLNGTSPVDKLIDLVPDVVEKANNFIEKSLENPKKALKNTQKNQTVNDNQKDEEESPDDVEDWHKS